MEDLTSSEADLNPAFASGSFETDRIIGGVDKTMMRMGPEWVVPLQYSNSPIVQELAESGEERPKPPLVNHYASAVTMQVSTTPWPSRSDPFVETDGTRSEFYCSVIFETGLHGDISKVADEELQICLCLPYAVLACQTTKELQSLALLGQDFWTSETALMRSPSRASDMSSTQSTSFMNLDECLPRIAPTLQRPSGYRNNVPKLGKLSKPKKRSSTGRDSGVSGDTPFALQSESRRDVAGNQNDVNSSSPPMKCDRAEESPGEADHISRSERRTQSVRTKSVNPPPVSGSSSTGRRSFLKTLFFGGGGSSNPSQNRRDPINQLAHCQYFVPFEKETVRSSKSAFEIGSPSEVDDWSKKHHANQMSTFKPSYDEVVMSARVCPLPMRRERSDLCASSVMRLARHTERSPGPACTMSTAIKPLQTKVPKRQPLRPPDTACDPKTISNCIDELRRRRLQFTDEKAAEQPSQISSPQISLRQRNNWDSNQQNGDEVPRYTSRASQRDHRMSVPNLSPEPSSVVIQSAKALREKLGRNGDGELSTINEGLITPVIRRKQFNQPSTLTSNVNNEAVFPNSPSAKRASHTDSPKVWQQMGLYAGLKTCFAFLRTFLMHRT
nr:Protein TAG-333, isoform a [Haemonchus contortus]